MSLYALKFAFLLAKYLGVEIPGLYGKHVYNDKKLPVLYSYQLQ